MKTMQQWFDDYSVSHQNETNQKIHFICVPAIFFSIVGMLLSIPIDRSKVIKIFDNPMIENWATFALFLVLAFYFNKSFRVFLKMLVFSTFCLVANYYLSHVVPILPVSLGIFILAWIGQFYGHKIEGKKPSFFKDLQFLLIGPAWVFEKLIKK